MEGADFEWDDTKAAHNLASHGVSFEAAQLAFDAPFAVRRPTDTNSFEDFQRLCDVLHVLRVR